MKRERERERYFFKQVTCAMLVQYTHQDEVYTRHLPSVHREQFFLALSLSLSFAISTLACNICCPMCKFILTLYFNESCLCLCVLIFPIEFELLIQTEKETVKTQKQTVNHGKW